MPKLSVIIVSWNGKHLLEACLGSLRRQTFRDFETILVDNGSSDGSVEYIQAQFPEARVLILSENLGFTGGNIAGYEIARGEIIVLLNNDTEVHEDWLSSLHEATLQYPNSGSFASKMMYFDDRTRIENCGFALGLAGTTTDLGRDEIDGPAWNRPRAIFGACGGAVAYRRTMLQEIGFLDPDFFAVYEDVDLAFRAQLRGYSCIFVPNAVVYHRYRSTLGKLSDRQVFYSQRNIEWVYWKNMPSPLLLRSAPQRLLYGLGSAMYFMKLGRGRAFFQAKLSALQCFRSLVKKRREIQRLKTITNSQVLDQMSPSFASKWRKFKQSFQAWAASQERAKSRVK